MINVLLAADGGDVSLSLELDDETKILAVKSAGPERLQDVLAALADFLPGQGLEHARVRAPEHIAQRYPRWGLKEAQLVDELLREAHYQLHRKVQVQGLVLCRCHKIERHQLAGLIKREGVTTLDELRPFSAASTACGSCRPEVTRLLEELRPQGRRWQGRSHSEWVLLLEDSLAPWHQRYPELPRLKVKSFEHGAVKLSSERRLSADEEWELTQKLESYWAEGFAAPVAVFFAFS